MMATRTQGQPDRKAYSMATEVRQDHVIRQVVEAHPGIDQVFKAHGLPCTGCHVSNYETVAGGAKTHRLNLDQLLADLNQFVASGAVPAPKKLPMLKTPGAGKAPRAGIKHVIAIVSGKGGVGKSLITGLLAVTLRRSGYRVGILDGDITGPSIPRMFGLHAHAMPQGTLSAPRTTTGISVMSMNLLLDEEDQAVIWRGPMVAGAIKQFFNDVEWGELDFLFVDLPPGTSDAPMTAMQSLPLDGVIVVSTPQDLATMVVTKAVHMAQRLEVPILGVVENMSYVMLPGTGEPYEVFGPSQGPRMVALSGAPLLGRLPIDPEIARLCDAGGIEGYRSEPFGELAVNFLKIAQRGEETSAGPGGLLKLGKLVRGATSR
ncbi:MAG TPA: P-loop NTPase [Chloroflexota bacterium]|nr:P-loop NTPase [Chloroflexota bacterium]